MKETQAALDQLVSGKVMSQQPKTLPQQPGAPTYLKYKPLHSGPQHNSGAEHRIIKMQDMPVDPMEPPKFRHKKVRCPPGLRGIPGAPCAAEPPVAPLRLLLPDCVLLEPGLKFFSLGSRVCFCSFICRPMNHLNEKQKATCELLSF